MDRRNRPKPPRTPVAERGIAADIIPIEVAHEKSLYMNNHAEVAGVLVEDLKFSHDLKGEKYYSGRIRTKVVETTPDGLRHERTADVLFVVSEDLLVGMALRAGDLVQIKGRRAHRNEPKESGGIRQHQFVFAKYIRPLTSLEGVTANLVTMDGYLCKGGDRRDPYRIFARRTEDGWVCDLHLAINRPAGMRIVDGEERLRVKTDHVVCVAKGDLAREAAKLQVGDRLRVEGYMTNRFYSVKVKDAEGNPVVDETGQPKTELRECHEVVLTRITLVDEQLRQEPQPRASVGGRGDE